MMFVNPSPCYMRTYFRDYAAYACSITFKGVTISLERCRHRHWSALHPAGGRA